MSYINIIFKWHLNVSVTLVNNFEYITSPFFWIGVKKLQKYPPQAAMLFQWDLGGGYFCKLLTPILYNSLMINKYLIWMKYVPK